MKLWQFALIIAAGPTIAVQPILLVPIAWFLVFLAVRQVVRRGRRRPLS